MSITGKLIKFPLSTGKEPLVLTGLELIRDNGGIINKNVIKYFYSWRKNIINFVLLYEEIFIGVLYGL